MNEGAKSDTEIPSLLSDNIITTSFLFIESTGLEVKYLVFY